VQIIGAEDDRGFTDRERAFLQTLYPQATVKIFPAPTGHMSFLTRADEYTAIVRHFIESVTGS
jgi:homoserine acetyltransferase